MEHKELDDYIRNEFRSILNILIHFSMSLIELLSILALLGLQIALTVTQTCAFRIWIVFWSFPFLLLSPISLWLVLWRRSTTSCLLAISIQFCSTLFATGIIIVSFLVLIGQMGFVCSTSSSTMLNSALIGIAGLLKLFNYIEILLLYWLIKNPNQSSTIFMEEYHDGNDELFTSKMNQVNVWHSWSTIPSETYSYSDIFFA